MILVRSAQGLYWMSRYLARAEHLCRMLALQMEAMVDRPFREVHFGWSRIYGCVDRQPPWGDIGVPESDEGLLFDSYSLAEDLTLERTTPESVWSCFALGRENARADAALHHRRDVAGPESALPAAAEDEHQRHLAGPLLRAFTTTRRAPSPPSPARQPDTMYRDENWFFMRLGRALERTQLTTSLFITQLSLGENGGRLLRRGLGVAVAPLPRLRRLHAPLRRAGGSGPRAGPPGHRRPAAELALPLIGPHRGGAGRAGAPGRESAQTRNSIVSQGDSRALVRYEWEGRHSPEPLLRRDQPLL